MVKSAWGIKPKNGPQGEALKSLLDPSIDLVVLEGTAGSGKTLLALAAGLEQIIENRMYKDIIFTRAPIGVGEDLGFLPGEISDKMLPWAGALIDNLEFLVGDGKLTGAIIESKIKILAMQHMRGRSFTKRYVIIDEVQNITQQQLKVLITRAGEDCKIVCLGDRTQIDNKKLKGENNGLSYLIEKMSISRLKGADFIEYVLLPDCERSRLCSWANENL